MPRRGYRLIAPVAPAEPRQVFVSPPATAQRATIPAAAFAPPPRSIAVLPFVNISGDKEQDYFSDGLTEELLDSLSRINELQVAARTSSFYFKGKDVDLPAIAHKLNVASVLEGSVRRSGNKIRITAQLNNAVTGFHLWSQSYDRDLSDVLQLQTDVANAVATALKVTLLGDVAAKIELGGTRNPAAFDAYVRASVGYWTASFNERDALAAIAGLTEAIRLDPEYARAYAERSLAISSFAPIYATQDGQELPLSNDPRRSAKRSCAGSNGEGYQQRRPAKHGVAVAEIPRRGFAVESRPDGES